MARVLGKVPDQGGTQGRVLGQAGEAVKSKGFSFDFKKILKEFLNVQIGGAKGVASTVGGAATLSEKGARVLLRKPLAEGQQTVGQKLQEKVKPVGTAQKVGFFGEQVAEFFIPGTAVVKGAKALKAGRLLGKAPKVARLVKPALQAAGAGVVGAVQTGDVVEGAQIGAITAAAGPVFKGIGSLADRLSKVIAKLTIPAAGKELTKDLARKLDIGGAIQKTGISLTREALKKKVNAAIAKFGRQLGERIDDVVKTDVTKVTTIKKVTEGLKDKLLEDPKLFRKLGATPIEFGRISKTIQSVITRYRRLIGNKTFLNQKDLQELKVMLGDGLETEFKRAIGAVQKVKPFTEMAIRTRLKGIIEKNVPQAAALNKLLAPLFEAKKRLLSKAPRGSFLIDVIAGGLAGGGLNQLTENPVKFFRNAVLGIAAERLARGTAAKTVGATVLKGISKLANNQGFLQALRKLATEEGE